MRIYWINQFMDGSLAVMPAPAGGAALNLDVGRWGFEGIEVVASLLEDGEVHDLDAAREASLCKDVGIEFLSFPIPDKEAPAPMEAADSFIRGLSDRVAAGRPVAVHCRAGIGRSSTIAAGILMRLGAEREAALDMIKAARGLRVPETDAQARWLERFEERLRARA